ncbi:protein Lines homolog 1 isoform X2 [Tupaia chinensis]|uniref:protein Lines homolog 1 isoform X2 n=1 Tax=Tupaia chinensis TaxID=246437 RepID=UPI000FFB64F9|nr:protein Lines homolog 1 isoform X2 [Tupaia chinensis]
MDTFREVVDQLYTTVVLGRALEHDGLEYVFYLNPASSDHDGATPASLEQAGTPGHQRSHQPHTVSVAPLSTAPVCSESAPQRSSAREVTLLQLTVIQVMVTRVLSAETELCTKEKYRNILEILLESSGIESTLVTLSNSWIAFCQNKLSEYSQRGEVLPCLWTLTVMIKEIFKDTSSQKTEILKQFLTPFDSALQAFYNSLFSQHFANCQETSKITNTFICSLDLLELLLASRIHLKLHFTCQRILFLKPSYLLNVITWPVQAFVKRKFIIFLKKCLLWKMGEDLCRGSLPASLPPDRHLDADTLTLADAVLHAVNLGLLKTLSVDERPSYFGGCEVQPGHELVSGPDHVILRAASLVIMKSLEIKFQNCTSANEMKVDLQRFMSELLTFLKPHLQPPLQEYHPCEWLSRVFIEQDDDMLEAARASLHIYLKVTRDCEAAENPPQGKETWNHHTHEHGYSPHCIFLFFVKNLSFDASVLLDFLISSETCFLEYFVKYLKLLQRDWHHFFITCRDFDATSSKCGRNIRGRVTPLGQERSSSRTPPPHLTGLDNHTDARARAWPSQASLEPLDQVTTSKGTHAAQPRGLSAPRSSRGLVDYDSSSDSEAELPDERPADSRQASLHQEAMQKLPSTTRTSKDEKELCQEPQSGPRVPEDSNTSFSVDWEVAPNNLISEGGVLSRTLKCLQELQGALDRLQKKNLFPYNPAALLKLLKRVEMIYNPRMRPL